MTWSPLGFCDWVAYFDILSFFTINTRIRSYENSLVRHIGILTLKVKDRVHPILHMGFHLGSHVKKNGHTLLQPLWCSLLLLLKCPPPLSCKTCAFSLWKNWLQPYLEHDMSTFYIPLFMFLRGIQCFLKSFLSLFWADSYFWECVFWERIHASSEFFNIYSCNLVLYKI